MERARGWKRALAYASGIFSGLLTAAYVIGAPIFLGQGDGGQAAAWGVCGLLFGGLTWVSFSFARALKRRPASAAPAKQDRSMARMIVASAVSAMFAGFALMLGVAMVQKGLPPVNVAPWIVFTEAFLVGGAYMGVRVAKADLALKQDRAPLADLIEEQQAHDQPAAATEAAAGESDEDRARRAAAARGVKH